MANTKSTQHEIDLTSSLNLNKFKADIKPYEGFNERNAPYYGGCLSPLYIKDDGVQESTVQFYNGDKYYIKNGGFYKNDQLMYDLNGTGTFTREIWEQPVNTQNINFVDVCQGVAIGTSNRKIYIYIENQLVKEINGTYVHSTIYSKDANQDKKFAIEYLDTNSNTVLYVGAKHALTGQFSEAAPSIASLSPFYNENRLEFSDTGNYLMYNSLIFNCYTSGSSLTVNLLTFSTSYNSGSKHITTTSNGANITTTYYHDGEGATTRSYSNLKSAIQDRDALFAIYLPCSANIDANLGFILLGQDPDVDYPRNRYLNHVGVSSVSQSGTTVNVTPDYPMYFSIAYVNTSDSLDMCLPKIRRTSYLPFFIHIINNQEGDDVGKTCFASYLTRYSTMYSVPAISEYSVQAWSTSVIDNYDYPMPAGGLFYYDTLGKYRILSSNNGQVQGISYCTDISHIGTLLTSWGSVDGAKNIYITPGRYTNSRVTYYDLDNNEWVIINHEIGTVPNKFTIIGDYAVFNTDAEINCISLKDEKTLHWASDWNNRVNIQCSTSWKGCLIGSIPTDINFINKSPALISSGQNINWLNGHSISSTAFSPIVSYISDSIWGEWKPQAVGVNTIDQNYVDVYKDWKYLTTIVSSSFTTNGETSATSTIPNLLGTIYPSDVRYNIPLFFDVITSPYDLTIVRFGETGFLVMYYDTQIRYQYLASSIASFENAFIIQGQAYGITRNKIYSISYSANTIQSIQPITTIEGLEYIGATIYNAYFYSPTARIIYSFGADNNLVVFSQADTFAEITGASYIPATGSILIGVNEVQGETETGCLYVLNERFGIYRINDIDGFKYASYLNDNSVGCVTDTNKLYRLTYEAVEGFTKKDIILDTAFYGAGSNVVSVNDCWYIRVTDPEHNSGEIQLSVSTLTDIGRSTENKTFKIKENDWDELTDTIYIRFQPKLQRAVGVSLHIESPFKIGYIGVGATPETLQLNKGTI